MRAAPCGLGGETREDAFRLARDTSVLTHGHPSAYLSAAYLASVVWDCARGVALPDAMSHADGLLAAERGAGELVSLLTRVRKLATKGPPGPRAVESLGGGWVGHEALAIALLCALTFDPKAPRAVATALWRAAAHSGDSDSTAAVTGNLIGCMVGARALPKRWLRTLELRDAVERIARDFHASLILGRPLDREDYPPN
jgi:ADP-ribosylglycohydrolase